MLLKLNSRKYLKSAYDKFSIEKLIEKSKQNLLFPFYHTISNEGVPHISNIYPVRDEKLFIKDIDFLLKHFEPTDIETINKQTINNQQFSKPSFHITFDDGLSELYYTAIPILEQKGIPATIFINTGFVDNKALFYRYKVSLIIEKVNLNSELIQPVAELLALKTNNRVAVLNALLVLNYKSQHLIELILNKIELDVEDYLKNSKPYLTSNQIKDLIKRGFKVGSHSVDHPFFNNLSIHEQKEQITKSFQYLIENFNVKNKYFSFPFSDEGVSLEFFEWLYKTEGCDLTFGTSGLKRDFSSKHIHRVAFDGSLSSAEDIVKSQYFNYMVKDIVGKNKIERK